MKPFVHEIEQKQDSTRNYNSYRVEWSKTLFIQGAHSTLRLVSIVALQSAAVVNIRQRVKLFPNSKANIL